LPQNIELKVGCSLDELAAVRDRLARRPVPPLESFHQTDTYFGVPAGRFKLRVINAGDGGRSAELIQYQRPETIGARVSTYRRIPVAPEAAVELELALSDALGVLTTIRKARSVAIWRSTRIHLDEVDDLGCFVELETVLSDDLTVEGGQAQLDDVVAWLGLAGLDSIAGSYSDLMLRKGQHL
jgi:adenylate cyclase class IV